MQLTNYHHVRSVEPTITENNLGINSKTVEFYNLVVLDGQLYDPDLDY